MDNQTNFTEYSEIMPSWLIKFRLIKWYVIIGIAAVGGVTNMSVLIRLAQILSVKNNRKDSPNWVLATMCAANILCLFSLGLFSCIGYLVFDLPDSWNGVKTFFCASNVYLAHTGFACSMWCWVVLSFLRYIAVAHPIGYVLTPILRKPLVILSLTTLECVICESWTFFLVHYDSEETMDCSVTKTVSPSLAKGVMTAEIIYSYMIPAIMIIILDVVVLKRPHHNPTAIANVRVRVSSKRTAVANVRERVSSKSMTGGEQTSLIQTKDGHRHRHLTRRLTSVSNERRSILLKRYLLLIILNLFLNAPCAILNTGFIHEPLLFGNPHAVEVFTGVGYILYCSQFSINVLYLWFLIINEPQKTLISGPQKSLTQGYSSAACSSAPLHCTLSEESEKDIENC